MDDLGFVKRYADIRERLFGPPPPRVIAIRRATPEPEPEPETPCVPPPMIESLLPAVETIISAVAEPERFIAALVEMLQPLPERSVYDVMRATAALAGLSVAELLSGRKGSQRHSRVHPRQIGMTVCVLGLRRSMPRVGYVFGGRDHTTVLNAVWRWRSRVEPVISQFAAKHEQVHRDA